VLAAALVAAAHSWDCIIADRYILVTKSFLLWHSVHRTPRKGNLGIRVEVATGSDDDTIFPCRLRLVDDKSMTSSLWLDFQHKTNADRFVGVLRQFQQVNVEYWTTRGTPLDHAG
jgi:hypothetical protein